MLFRKLDLTRSIRWSLVISAVSSLNDIIISNNDPIPYLPVEDVVL